MRGRFAVPESIPPMLSKAATFAPAPAIAPPRSAVKLRSRTAAGYLIALASTALVVAWLPLPRRWRPRPQPMAFLASNGSRGGLGGHVAVDVALALVRQNRLGKFLFFRPPELRVFTGFEAAQAALGRDVGDDWIE